jgi:flagellar basal-body rod modification protein FlgD
MASAVNALTGSSASSIAAAAAASSASAASSSASATASAPSEEVFLQLLVAQLKNQDPLNPTDSTQFVSELAQFSQLEQVIAIRSDIENGVTHPAQSSTSGASSTTQTQS